MKQEFSKDRLISEQDYYVFHLQGRQLLFGAKLKGEPDEPSRLFYLKHRHILAFTDDPYHHIRLLSGRIIRDDNRLDRKAARDTKIEELLRKEVLRRFNLDLAVAENFARLGTLGALKRSEALELKKSTLYYFLLKYTKSRCGI